MSTAIAKSLEAIKLAGKLADRPTDSRIGSTYYATDVNAYFVSRGSNKWGNLPVQSGGVCLNWVAGSRGKPGINADILAAAEATRMIVDPDFEISADSTNETSALCTYNAEGGLTLTTAGADADSMILEPHQDANQTSWTQWTWGTDREVGWFAHIQTGANITNAIIWAGLKLTFTPVVATDADQIFFRYEDDVAGGDWQAVYSIAGVDVAIDTDIAAVVSTSLEFAVIIDESRNGRMYLNGNLVATTTQLTDTIDLVPFIGVEADGAAAAKAITIYGQSISRSSG